MTTNPQDIASIAEGLSDAERMAVRFLWLATCDEVGTIETDEQFAAAVIYASLATKGLIEKPAFPLTRLTERGIAAALHVQEQNNEG